MASIQKQLEDYNDKYDPIQRTNTIVDAMDNQEIHCPDCGSNVGYTLVNDGRSMTLTIYCEDCDFIYHNYIYIIIIYHNYIS